MDTGAPPEAEVVILTGSDPVWTWIQQRLSRMSDFHSTAEADVPGALRVIARSRPAVVLLCGERIARGETDLLERIRGASPLSAVVIAASTAHVANLQRMHGSASFLSTGELTAERLRLALLSAAAGLLVKTPEIGAVLSVVDLTEHEREALRGLGRGLTERQMCLEFSVGRATVVRAIESLERKLDARGRFMLGVKAASLGLLNDVGDEEL